MATLTMPILAPGATPTVPTPFWGATMVPEVAVPWPMMSFDQTAFEVFGTPPTQETLAAALTWPARSGWVMSTPEAS